MLHLLVLIQERLYRTPLRPFVIFLDDLAKDVEEAQVLGAFLGSLPCPVTFDNHTFRRRSGLIILHMIKRSLYSVTDCQKLACLHPGSN